MLQNLNMSTIMTVNGGELTLNDETSQESGSALTAPADFRQFLLDLENNKIVASQSDRKIILADNSAEPETTLDSALLSLDGLEFAGFPVLARGPGQTVAQVAGEADDNLDPEAGMAASALEAASLTANLPGTLQIKATPGEKSGLSGESLHKANAGIMVAEELPDQATVPHGAPSKPRLAAENTIAPAAAMLTPATDTTNPNAFFNATGMDRNTTVMAPAAMPGKDARPDAPAFGKPAVNAAFRLATAGSGGKAAMDNTGLQGREPGFDRREMPAYPAEPPVSVAPAASTAPDNSGEILPGTGNNPPQAVAGTTVESRSGEPEGFQGLLAQTGAAASRLTTPVMKEGQTPTPQPQPYSLYSGHAAGTDEWRHEFAAQVRWLGEHGIGKAEITLKPAELGSIEIRIMSTNDQTTVNFITSTSAARDTIEQSLPRLREMLSNSGLQLSGSTVSHQEMPGGSGDQKHGYRQLFNQADTHFSHSMADLEIAVAGETQLPPLTDRGHVDLYV